MLRSMISRSVILLCVLECLQNVKSLEVDLTIEVNPGIEECFFETVKKPNDFEIEYQVLDGGDLDINFMVQAPDGRVLISETQKTDAVHKFEASTAGDYKICFDNTFSHFARKLVFFELMSDPDEEDESDDDDEGVEKINDWKKAREELATSVDMTMEEFKKLMDNLRHNLDRTVLDQQILRNYEARDRNIQENNFQRVNLLSGIQVFIMVSVALTQVILIRSLFNDKSRVQGVKAKT